MKHFRRSANALGNFPPGFIAITPSHNRFPAIFVIPWQGLQNTKRKSCHIDAPQDNRNQERFPTRVPFERLPHFCPRAIPRAEEVGAHEEQDQISRRKVGVNSLCPIGSCLNFTSSPPGDLTALLQSCQ